MATQSLGERLLEFRAACAQSYKDERGTLDGFNAHWTEVEPDYLIMASKLTAEANANAKTERKRQADQERMAALKRSQMSPKQISEFLQGGHSLAEFQSLPE